ncbi:MAG: cadherin-like domain-containing protein, partial [Algicola sp.]|nr:cadherin-like domain-containing protein [Algicola sp.]
ASDVDGDTLSITSVSSMFGSTEVVDNQLDYLPAEGFFGTDTVVYAISDGSNGSSTATLSITIVANGYPLAVADTASTLVAGTLTIDVLSNDSDPENDALTVVAAIADKGFVTINGDNSLTYRASSTFVGVDTVSYRIRDALGGEAVGTVTVTVTAEPPPAPPVKPAKPKPSSGGGALLFLLLWGLLIGLVRRGAIKTI